MLQPVLDHIKENIRTLNPNTFQAWYAGARQKQDGKVVIVENSEDKYVGLKDTEFNYFYIRYRDEIDIDVAPSDNRSTSCFELEGNAPLRLVAWVKNASYQKLTEVLLNDITSTDFNTMTTANRKIFSGFKFEFNSIILDGEKIYKEETGDPNNDNVTLEKGVTLIAIDFGLIFNYKMKNETCIDRDVCVGCTT